MDPTSMAAAYHLQQQRQQAPAVQSTPSTPIQQSPSPLSQPPSQDQPSPPYGQHAHSNSQSQRPQASREHMMTAFRERLTASGEKQKLKEQLKNKLLESQWRNIVIAQCKAVMAANGLERTTLDMLVNQSIKVARENVPPQVKSECLENIRRSLAHLSRRPDSGTSQQPPIHSAVPPQSQSQQGPTN